MADANLKVSILAVDKASATLKKVGKGLGDVAKVAGGIALANVGADLASFAKQSIGAFEDTGKEALKLQRYLGGTIEDASRVGHALKMSGLDANQAAKAMGIMSKFTSSAGQQLDVFQASQYAAAQAGKQFKGKLGPSASVMADLGIQFRDASGEMRSTQDIMLEFADAIKALPPGVDRTSYVLKAFGKSGMDMLPFLSKGADGIRELMGESDALGTTLNQTDADAIKKSIVAKRKLGESIRGVQIQLGKFLYPAMLAFTNLLSSKVVPVMGGAVKILTKVSKAIGYLFDGSEDGAYSFAEVMDNVFGNSGKLIPAFEAIGEKVQAFVGWFKNDLLPTVKTLASEVMSRLVPALVTFGGWLVKYQGWLIPIAAGIVAIVAAMKVYATVMGVVRAATAAWVAIQTVLNVVLSANPIGLIVLAIAGLVAGLVVAYKRSETFRNIVDGAMRVVGKVFGWLKEKAGGALDWIKRNWDTIMTVLKNTPIGIYLRLVWASIKWLRDKVVPAFKWIKDRWDSVSGAFSDFMSWLASNKDTLINYIVNPFITAFNLVAKGWNATIGGLSFSFPDWLKYTGGLGAILAGKSFTVPNASYLDYVSTGGGSPADARKQKSSEGSGNKWAKTTGLAVGGRILSDGMALLHKGEVVMPYERAMGIERGGPQVVVHVHGSALATKQEIARTVVDALKSSGARGLALA